jgi:hypothetical protein
LFIERCRGFLTIDYRDRKPGTRTCHPEQQPGEPAAGDQQLDIVGHRKRMKPGPQAVQMLMAELMLIAPNS